MSSLNPPAPPPSGKYLFTGTLESWDGVLEVVGAQKWTYLGATHASIASVTPNNGPVSGGTVVTINGAGFTGVTNVTFGSVGAKFTFVNDKQIVATAPAVSAAQVVDVTVVTANDGTTTSSIVDRFTYGTPVAPPPAPLPEVTTPTVSTGTLDNILSTGLSELVLQDIKGNPTSYTVSDISGYVIESGALPTPPEAQVLHAVTSSVPSGAVSLSLPTLTLANDVLVLLYQVGITPSVPTITGGGVAEWTIADTWSTSNYATGIAYGVVTSAFTPVVLTVTNKDGGNTSGTLVHARGLATQGTVDSNGNSYVANSVSLLPVTSLTPSTNGALCFYVAGGWTSSPPTPAVGGLTGLPTAQTSYVAGFTQGPAPAGAGWTVNSGGNTGWLGLGVAFTTTGTVSLPPIGGDIAWAPDWYYIEFLNDTGATVDSVQVSLFRDLGTLPSPEALPPYNVANPAFGDIDLYLRAWTGMGAERFSISQAVNPSVIGTGSGQTLAQITTAIALRNSLTVNDPARPQPLLVNFPNDIVTATNSAVYSAGVTQVVEAVGPGTASNVLYFEGLNEPISNNLSPAQSAAQFVVFEAAVKAGNPNAIAVGPSDVGHSVEPFLTDVGGSLPGAVSNHYYNDWSGDFVVTDAALSSVRSAMAMHGIGSAPMWCTEAGQVRLGFAGFLMQDPMRAAQWWAQLLLTGDRWGMPKEQINLYYDRINGDPYAAWLRSTDNGLDPRAVLTRVFSEECFGLTYSHALTFGTIGDKFYRGNVYAGSSGAMIALTAQGSIGDSVSLSGITGQVAVSDWRGRVFYVSPVAGVAVIPVSGLPTYVRLPSATGVNAVQIIATDLATSATASCSSGTTEVNVVNNGSFGPGSYYGAPMFTSQTLPEAVTLTWPSAQNLGRVRIRQGAPWSDVGPTGAMLAGKLEYWTGSAWLPAPTVPGNHWDSAGNYSNPTAMSRDTNIGHNGGTVPPNCFYSSYDQHWCHNIPFSTLVTTTQLRWTVAQASRGHFPDSVGGKVTDAYIKQTLSVSALLAFAS